MTLSGRGILSFLPNLEVFINDLLGEDVRAQAQLEFFGPTPTQKPGSTLDKCPRVLTYFPAKGGGVHLFRGYTYPGQKGGVHLIFLRALRAHYAA